MRVTSYIRIDMSRPNNETVHVMQYDELSRWVHADLSAFDEAWEIPEGVNVMVRYRKIDGTVGLYSVLDDDSPAYTIDGSSIEIGLAKQAMTVDGKFRVDIVFRLNGAVLSAFPFSLSVKPAAASEDEIAAASEDYITESLVNISADAHTLGPAADPTVDVEASGMSFSFDFGIPQGPAGPSSAVTSSTQQWQSSSSGSEVPTGTWLDNPPAVSAGSYLWTKNTVTYNNGQTAIFYAVGYQATGAVDSVMGVSPGVGGDVAKAALMNLIYPVGSIYMSVNNTSPQTLFGGTWTQIKDCFLLAASEIGAQNPTYEVDEEDDTIHGSATQTVDFSNGQANIGFSNTHAAAIYMNRKLIGEDPITHDPIFGEFDAANKAPVTWTGADSTDTNISATELEGTQTIDIMPPYTVVYVWKRTA